MQNLTPTERIQEAVEYVTNWRKQIRATGQDAQPHVFVEILLPSFIGMKLNLELLRQLAAGLYAECEPEYFRTVVYELVLRLRIFRSQLGLSEAELTTFCRDMDQK